MIVKYDDLVHITKIRLASRTELPSIHENTPVAVNGLTVELPRVLGVPSFLPWHARSNNRLKDHKKRLGYLESHGIGRIAQMVTAFGYFDGDNTLLKALPWVVKKPDSNSHSSSVRLSHFIAANELIGHKDMNFTTRGVDPDMGFGYVFTRGEELHATIAHAFYRGLPHQHVEALGRMTGLFPEVSYYLLDGRRGKAQLL